MYLKELLQWLTLENVQAFFYENSWGKETGLSDLLQTCGKSKQAGAAHGPSKAPLVTQFPEGTLLQTQAADANK